MRYLLMALTIFWCSTVWAKPVTVADKIQELDNRVTVLEEALVKTTELLKQFIRKYNINRRLTEQEIARLRAEVKRIEKLKTSSLKREKQMNVVEAENETESMPQINIKIKKRRLEPRSWIIATIVNLNRSPQEILKSLRDIEFVTKKPTFLFDDGKGHIGVVAYLTDAEVERLKLVYPFYNPFVARNLNDVILFPTNYENIIRLLNKVKKEREIKDVDFLG